MELNDDQRAAVTGTQNACIRACPGSGKTRTILAKLLKCVEDVKGTARRIACITYTHAAVDEIELRLKEYGFSDEEDYYEVSTIHSFCLANILQPFHYMIESFARGFEIISPESEEWHDLISGIAEVYGVAREQYDSFALVHRRHDGTLFVPPEIPDEAARYLIERLDSQALVSFSEIVYHSIRLIQGNAFISRGLASRYCWIIVDEFQDTSEGQVIVLRSIAAHNKTRFFLVGDPNQSIMGFAGAFPELMMVFSEEINAVSDGTLPGNYRCSAAIVDHAERLLPSVPPMKAVGATKDLGIIPQLFSVDSAANGIMDYFIPALEGDSIRLGDAAVLAPWWLPLYHLGRLLRERGIPIIGPGSRPYRRTHIFVEIAESLCAYVEEPSPEIFRKTQKALFNMVCNVTGSPDWRVFSYNGRVCLCALAHAAKAAAEEYEGGAISWLRRMAVEISSQLKSADFLPADRIHLIRASVEDIIKDMERNKVDIDNLTVSDLGLYAKPKNCLNLITMHGSKGREFDAVALVDLHNGRLPHYKCQKKEQLEEARRLFYVSITRARKLLMYFVDSSNPRNEPSPFLYEMGLLGAD